MLNVNVSAKQEIKAAQQIVNQLKEFKSKNWAIGINGDTMQPDNLLAFFSSRSIPFQYYFVNRGIGIGNPSAYDADIFSVEKYIGIVRKDEENRVNATISEIEHYKSKNWAIGLNGDTLQPDGFLPFFAQRELPFEFYVRSQGVSLGDSGAYEKNVKTLKAYLSSL